MQFVITDKNTKYPKDFVLNYVKTKRVDVINNELTTVFNLLECQGADVVLQEEQFTDFPKTKTGIASLAGFFMSIVHELYFPELTKTGGNSLEYLVDGEEPGTFFEIIEIKEDSTSNFYIKVRAYANKSFKKTYPYIYKQRKFQVILEKDDYEAYLLNISKLLKGGGFSKSNGFTSL